MDKEKIHTGFIDQDVDFYENTEFYIDHEMRMQLEEIGYKKLNRKLNIITSIASIICILFIIPIAVILVR